MNDQPADERVLNLSGVRNFRDYGGYAVAGGGRVKRGMLWRSGEHGEASDTDLDHIAALDLRYIVDLRGNGEREVSPCRRHPDFDGEVLFYDGETGGLAPLLEQNEGTMTEEYAHRAMEAIYADLPNRENLLWIFRRYFASLNHAAGSAPGTGDFGNLIHCHAGKDRTGMAVALLHHTLGVHPDDAMADFLMTNAASDIDAQVARKAEGMRKKFGPMEDEAVRVFMGVDERYLLAARRAVEESHGSLDAFLSDVLNVDDARRDALRLHWIEA